MSDTSKLTRWILMGAIGLGAGAITAYLTDPRQGPARRARLVKSSGRLWERAAGHAKKSLLDTQHHLTGISARFHSSLRADEPSGQVLEARVRSRIGRVLSHPRKLHVLCDHGLVTLWGTVPQNEIYQLLRAVKAVPGVKEIQEHLETCGSEEISKRHLDSFSEAREAGKLGWSPSKRMLV
ncbi:MAG TPA: BON domain-containing protein, partial [Terriglobales bacterium]|nr:BON domain-containing protein [Terriglobales bacterium]